MKRGLDQFTDAPEICLLPAGHPLGKKQVITPEDLDRQSFVALGQNDPYAQRLQRVFETHEVSPDIVIEVHNSIMAAEATAQGLGVTVINPFSALSFRHRDVVFRRFSEELPFRSTIIRSKFQPLSALTDAFEKCLYDARDQYLLDLELLLDANAA